MFFDRHDVCFMFIYLQGLMRARSLLSSDYGRVFVNISSPISLHDMCQKWGISRIPHGLYPR